METPKSDQPTAIATPSLATKARVTVKDLARELDVSVATVSRALSNDANIAAKTRERVLRKAAEMGYAPNLFARGLITQRSRIAALFASNITNPFYPEVVVKISRRLQEAGLHTMLFTSAWTTPCRWCASSTLILPSFWPRPCPRIRCAGPAKARHR